MVFEKTKFSSEYFEMNYDESHYLERTKRNHYWLGGKDGQKKLKELKVGIAGLGGMEVTLLK